MKESLENLKVGDKVAYIYSYGRESNIITITKITKTMIICDTMRFRKSSGMSINSSGFHHTYITILTDKLKESILKKKLSLYIKNFNWETVPYDTLKTIYEKIKPYKRDE